MWPNFCKELVSVRNFRLTLVEFCMHYEFQIVEEALQGARSQGLGDPRSLVSSV